LQAALGSRHQPHDENAEQGADDTEPGIDEVIDETDAPRGGRGDQIGFDAQKAHHRDGGQRGGNDRGGARRAVAADDDFEGIEGAGRRAEGRAHACTCSGADQACASPPGAGAALPEQP
jgi:hypothetical protein